MVPHEVSKQGKEPKLKQTKERMKPFEGNYSSVQRDYVDHNIATQKGVNTRVCCHVKPQERENMVYLSAKRLLEDDPQLAKQVFQMDQTQQTATSDTR